MVWKMNYPFKNFPNFQIYITSTSNGYGFEVNLFVYSNGKKTEYSYRFPSQQIFEQIYYKTHYKKKSFLEAITSYQTWGSNEKEIKEPEEELTLFNNLQKIGEKLK